MCIIVYKPAGIPLPGNSILYNCDQDNPDGIGYMYRADNGRIVISKGFMDINDFLDDIEKVPNILQKDVAIHFRLATHGNISPGNCHPFPITDKIIDLRRERYVCNIAIMHNGIVPDLSHQDKTLSDTMCAVKIISECGEGSDPAKKILSTGKFLVMDNHETRLYGDFIQDSGIYYSNFRYKSLEFYSSSSFEDRLDYECELFDQFLDESKIDFFDYDEDEIEDMFELYKKNRVFSYEMIFD